MGLGLRLSLTPLIRAVTVYSNAEQECPEEEPETEALLQLGQSPPVAGAPGAGGSAAQARRLMLNAPRAQPVHSGKIPHCTRQITRAQGRTAHLSSALLRPRARAARQTWIEQVAVKNSHYLTIQLRRC